MRRTLVALALGVLALLSRTAHAEQVTYTVAIGNNAPPSGETTLAPLRYADDDAIRYGETLGRLPGRVWLLSTLDSGTLRRHPEWRSRALAPTLAKLKEAVATIAARIAVDRARGATPVVFLTFSGHGSVANDGEYYLALLGGQLTRSMLYDEILEPLRDAQVHLIVDSCNADGVVGARGAFEHELDARTVPLDADEKQSVLARYRLERFPNVGVLIASAQNQEAHEWSQIEAGVFTYEVTSALLGAADVNGDSRVEYGEVAAFVAAANRALPNPTGAPRLVARAPKNKSPLLVDITKLERSLVLTGSPEKLGKFFIELPNGERWLEAHLPARARLTLALPLQRGSFLRSGESEAEIPLTASRIVRLESLKFSPSSVASRGSVERALREHLFSLPFDRDYYRRFAAANDLPAVSFDVAPAALPAWQDVPERSKAPAIALGAVGSGAAAVGLVSGYPRHRRLSRLSSRAARASGSGAAERRRSQPQHRARRRRGQHRRGRWSLGLVASGPEHAHCARPGSPVAEPRLVKSY